MSTIQTNPDRFSEGARQLHDIVAPTMGPFGQNIMPTGQNISSLVFRDGAWVIKSFFPHDQIAANAVARIRDAALSTLTAAGDGTSTTAVLLTRTYLAALEETQIYENSGQVVLRRIVADRVKEILGDMVALLEANTISLYGEAGVEGDESALRIDLLRKVATIAANNDKVIGAKVAEMVASIGENGSVQVEYSRTGEVETEVVPGYVFDGPLYSADFLPYGHKSVEMERPYVVLVDDMLATFEDFKHILVPYNKNSFLKNEGRHLVLICHDLTGVALATAIARNHVDEGGKPTGRKLSLVCVRPPRGVDRKAFFEDLSAVTGARIMGKDHGARLDTFNWSKDVGTFVKYLSCSQSRCTVLRDEQPTHTHRLSLEGLISRLGAQLKDAEADAVRDALRARLNALNGRVAIIRIPGETQGGVVWLKEVVEDSYLAAQAALKSGVLPGCGRALLWAYHATTDEMPRNFVEDTIAIEAVGAGVRAIFEAVMRNAGVPPAIINDLLDNLQREPLMNTYNVNYLFVTRVREAQEAAVAAGEDMDVDAWEQLNHDCLVDARHAGILDATATITAALRNTSSELVLWLPTKIWIEE